MGDIERAADAAPAKVTPKAALSQLLESNKGAVGASLPSGYSQERFVRLLLTAANTNPDLFECDPRSFLAAGVGAAQLGLEPNDARGLAYLLPYKDRRRGKVVNLIIGYRGMLDLARRSGMVSTINAFAVYEGDTFTYSLGLEPTLHHIPADGDEDPAKMTHVYAVAKVNGDPQFVVMTRRQVERVKASSQGASSSYSPWTTHYAEMAKKTALRRLCKYLPQTVEMANADAYDGTDLSLGDMGLTASGHQDYEPDDVLEVESTEAEVAA